MAKHGKIIWAPSAVEDLRVGFDYIQAESSTKARAWIQRILKSVQQLNSFPESGRIIPEIGKSRYRELIVGEYRIFHEVRDKEILIFRILHAKRLFEI